MKTLLIALALIASPQEECMAAKSPVKFPGAVPSRNSQIRSNALQAGAYTGPAPAAELPPYTVPDILCTVGAPAGLTANNAYLWRLKKSNAADITVTGWYGTFQNASGGAASMGLAIYEVRGIPESGDLSSAGLFLVPNASFIAPVANTAFLSGINFPVPFSLDGNKAYAAAFFTSTASVGGATFYTIPAALIAAYGSSGDWMFPMTAGSGFPLHVRFSSRYPGTDTKLTTSGAGIIQYISLYTSNSDVFIY